jgi:hypothetical protein
MVQEGHAGGKACICQWAVQHVAVGAVGGLVKYEEDEPGPQKRLALSTVFVV